LEAIFYLFFCGERLLMVSVVLGRVLWRSKLVIFRASGLLKMIFRHWVQKLLSPACGVLFG